MSQPQQKITITHGGIDYSFEDQSVFSDVTLRENAVSDAKILANDYRSRNFLTRCDVGDNVKIEQKRDSSDSTYVQTFGGWIEDLQPALGMPQGELVGINALGYDVALVNMRVREQYGAQSNNPLYNTLSEILTAAGHGIIPKYVNKVLASATDSGYSINTTKIADIASNFQYLYFPNKPAINSINDLMDLMTAYNSPNAGVHWTMIPSGTIAYLCVATVGAHENPPADVWSTWWNTDRTGSTIEVGKEIIVASFKKKRSEGNYVLFQGNFRRPANMDFWTEGSVSEWDDIAPCVVSDEATIFNIGLKSIKGTVTGGTNAGGFYYPHSTDLNLDLTKIGTRKAIPRLNFYMRRNDHVDMIPNVTYPWVELGTGTVAANNYFWQYINEEIPSHDTWYHVSLPIGPYYDCDESTRRAWRVLNNPLWTDIDYILFYFACVGAGGDDAILYVDGLNVQGLVTRGAYDSSKYATQKCRMLYFNDDVAKDDSLTATDDSGQIAQFCKAELIRAVQTPITGQIKIPLKPSIKAGQLAHIHYGTGTSIIDKDMRILEVTHHFGNDGATSLLTLTDDITNSLTYSPTDQYSILMKAVAPAFQDRVRGSLIAKDVDIDQTILEKSYTL